MSCHVASQAVRTVATRSPGGRDGPHKRLVIEAKREGEGEEEVGDFGPLDGLWFRDILGMTWHLVGFVVDVVGGRLRGGAGKFVAGNTVAEPVGILSNF